MSGYRPTNPNAPVRPYAPTRPNQAFPGETNNPQSYGQQRTAGQAAPQPNVAGAGRGGFTLPQPPPLTPGPLLGAPDPPTYAAPYTPEWWALQGPPVGPPPVDFNALWANSQNNPANMVNGNYVSPTTGLQQWAQQPQQMSSQFRQPQQQGMGMQQQQPMGGQQQMNPWELLARRGY